MKPLPIAQEDGMPNAVEAQRVEIENHSDRERSLKIVMTGVFGIAVPTGIANDVVYCNVVAESEVWHEDGKAASPSATSPASVPERFAALLCSGEEAAWGRPPYLTSKKEVPRRLYEPVGKY